MNNPYNYSNPNPNRPGAHTNHYPNNHSNRSGRNNHNRSSARNNPGPGHHNIHNSLGHPNHHNKYGGHRKTRRRNANNPRSRFHSGRNNHNPTAAATPQRSQSLPRPQQAPQQIPQRPPQQPAQPVRGGYPLQPQPPATPNPTVATTPGAAAIRRFPTTHPTDRTPAFTGERPASPMVCAWKTLPVIRCET